jgi:cation-transporting ATPase E
VLRFAIPSGLIAAAATFSAYWLARNNDVTIDQARTTATVVLLMVGLWVLVILARPLSPLRAMLVGIMVGLFAIALTFDPVREFYALDLPDGQVMLEAVVVGVIAILLLETGWQTSRRLGVGPAAASR